MISVVIFGAGNVAQHLFKAFSNNREITVNQWFNKDITKLEKFKNKTEITDDLKEIKSADLYVIAIKDDAVAKFSRELPFKDQFVVHTSGSVNIHDMDKKNRRGVIYPLQTFSAESDIDFSKVPLCIEAIDKSDFELLKKLSKSLKCKFYKISSEQRQVLHVAAVFVNNFVNQLYRMGHEIGETKNIDFDILRPLILETAKKAQVLSPFQAQTGPALRKDNKTIKKHLKLLENKEHKHIYELMTKSIKKTHGR